VPFLTNQGGKGNRVVPGRKPDDVGCLNIRECQKNEAKGVLYPRERRGGTKTGGENRNKMNMASYKPLG